MAFKTSEKYKSVIYSGDCRHKLKLLFNGVELADADVYCESLKVTSRIIPNGSTRFSLDNFVAKEAELVLHDIDTTIIQSPVNISIGHYFFEKFFPKMQDFAQNCRIIQYKT